MNDTIEMTVNGGAAQKFDTLAAFWAAYDAAAVNPAAKFRFKLNGKAAHVDVTGKFVAGKFVMKSRALVVLP